MSHEAVQFSPGMDLGRGQYLRAKVPCAFLADGSPVSIPLSILRGAEDGPVLFIGSAMHGTEITGIEVIRRLLREAIDPSRLRGTILAASILNPLAYRAHEMNTPQDGYNLNRVFPGGPNMLLSHRLAHTIRTHFVEPADIVVDLHANPSPAIQFSIVKGVADQSVSDASLKLAEAFGITTIEMLHRYEQHRTGTMVESALALGKPALTVELVYWRRIDEVSVQTGVRGILNILKLHDMLDGEMEPQRDTPVLPGRLTRTEITANRGGLVFWFKTAGEQVRKGELIGVIRDPWGDEVEQIISSVDGWILAWPLLSNQAANTGDFLTFIAFPRD